MQRKGRTFARRAWRTADWCGVVRVRVRFFFGGAVSVDCWGARSEGWLCSGSVSISAIPLWEEEEEVGEARPAAIFACRDGRRLLDSRVVVTSWFGVGWVCGRSESCSGSREGMVLAVGVEDI